MAVPTDLPQPTPDTPFHLNQPAYIIHLLSLSQRRQGYRRAAFWRTLGFPNCKLALQRRREIQALERRKYSLAELQEQARMPGLFDLEGSPAAVQGYLAGGVWCGSYAEKVG
jgi:hypothetical protein